MQLTSLMNSYLIGQLTITSEPLLLTTGLSPVKHTTPTEYGPNFIVLNCEASTWPNATVKADSNPMTTANA